MNKKDCAGFYFPFYICMTHDFTHNTSVGMSDPSDRIQDFLAFGFSLLFSFGSFYSREKCNVHDSDIVEFCHKMELPTVLGAMLFGAMLCVCCVLCVLMTDDGTLRRQYSLPYGLRNPAHKMYYFTGSIVSMLRTTLEMESGGGDNVTGHFTRFRWLFARPQVKVHGTNL